MIVLEGPDGSGKTSLIGRISEEFGLPIAPRVVTKDTEAMVDLREWTEKNVKLGFQKMLFDRHRLISEPIYGPIFRVEAEPGFNDLEWFHSVNSRFYLCRPVIIYCLPPFETVAANLLGDDDNVKVFKHSQRIYSSYVAKVSQDYLFYDRTYVWDYTNSTAETHLELIFNKINEALRGKK